MQLVYISYFEYIFRFKNRIGVTFISFVVNYIFVRFATLLVVRTITASI